MDGGCLGGADGACGQRRRRRADKVVLMLNWYVYGEHAPFYYGKAKGIYAAEGIDLEIQEGRGSARPRRPSPPRPPTSAMSTCPP